MKKLLLSIITVLLIVLVVITVVKGIHIGNFELLGVMQIKEENEKLDEKIQEATKLASTDFVKKTDDLEDSMKKLETEKNSYQDLVNVSTESEVEAANQLYFYELDFLWIRVGNHAKSEGIRMDVAATGLTEVDGESTTIQSDKKYRCNLNFTATGSYIGIASFIEDIEDDSELGFKIEDFKMIPSSEGSDTLTATFTCKDIVIKGVSASVTNTNNQAQDSTENQAGNTTENTNNVTTNNTVENTNSTVENVSTEE